MTDRILENTFSLCPKCLERISARICTDGQRVYMQKDCEIHGKSKGAVWNSLERYLWSFKFTKPGTPVAKYATREIRGCPFDCGLCPEHKQHTCLAILEVTEDCNIRCPICLASASEFGVAEPSLDKVGSALDSLLEHEGRPTPLQFSGGEPTIRKDLPEIISLARRKGFRFLEIDTNGIEIANHPELAAAYAEAGLDGIYLQFDGVDDATYEKIRGARLFKIKEKAIEAAQSAGLHVVLATTLVKGVNDHELWGIVDYALRKGLSGVNFQPFAMFGRYPAHFLNPMDRITNDDVPRLLEEQSRGFLRVEDFIPVPCPDNRCQMLAYIHLTKKGMKSVSRSLDVESLLDYYHRFTDIERMGGAIRELRQTLYDMWSSSAVPGKLANINLEHTKDVECLPCCNIPAPENDGSFFAIGTHAMMDAWNSDIHRHERCCIHEVTMDGRLIPFCLYNMTSLSGVRLYRQNGLKGTGAIHAAQGVRTIQPQRNLQLS